MSFDDVRFIIGVSCGVLAAGLLIVGGLCIRQNHRDRRESATFFKSRGLS